MRDAAFAARAGESYGPGQDSIECAQKGPAFHLDVRTPAGPAGMRRRLTHHG